MAPTLTAQIKQAARDLGFDVDCDLDLCEEIGEHFRRIAEQEGLPLGVPRAAGSRPSTGSSIASPPSRYW